MTAPEPLTPPDCDLRGLEYMPLLGQRLFGSEFNALASDSEWRAAMTLWWAAWTQCPAASLPDDDTALCRLADLGRDVKAWKKLRTRALHGFVKCADGRLYHPTLAQQALVAWDKRQSDRNTRTGDAERKARERAARSEMFQRLEAVGVTPEWNIKTADLRRLVAQHFEDGRRDTAGEVTDLSDNLSRDMSRLRRDGTRRDGTIEGRKEEGAGALDQPLPADLIDLTGELCRAGGIRHVDPTPIMAAQATVRQWLADGFDPATEILPTIRQAVTDATERIGSLAYFDAPLRQNRARQEARRNGHTADPTRGYQPHLRPTRPSPELAFRDAARAAEASGADTGGGDHLGSRAAVSGEWAV